ncbi:MAG TPA: hypothetical protein VMU10_09780 [Desulfomonilia bacterium]|nr:hypothetical protein [Desulfomonilia bacterium]
MKWKDYRLLLLSIATLVLIAGLVSAVSIYRTAEDDAGGALGYEVVGGSVYPIMPEDTKMYSHDLELYGGKAAVLADELRLWFAGLWHGKSLAYTIAFLSIVIALGFIFAARHLPSNMNTDSPDEYHRNG